MEKEFTPTELGIVDVNMKTPATTTGNLIYVAGFKDFVFDIQVTATGTGTTGYCGLSMAGYNSAGVQLFAAANGYLASSMNTKVSNQAIVVVGADFNVAVFCTVPGSPTPTANDLLQYFKGQVWIRPYLSATEASNATTCTASVRLRAIA